MKKWCVKYDLDNCVECHLNTSKHGNKGRCVRCYSKYRYRNDLKYRERVKNSVYKFKEENPERWKKMVNKAVTKYQNNNKEKVKIRRDKYLKKNWLALSMYSMLKRLSKNN